MNIDLTEPIPGASHFCWHEMVRTNHRAWVHRNRQVPIAFRGAGIALATLLEEVRTLLGDHPVIVHSGWRCPGLNEAIGGSETSQHCKFQAADFHVLNIGLSDVFGRIRASELAWGQLIAEGWDPLAGDIAWIHLSLGHPWRAAEKSQQVWVMSLKRRTEGRPAYERLS